MNKEPISKIFLLILFLTFGLAVTIIVLYVISMDYKALMTREERATCIAYVCPIFNDKQGAWRVTDIQSDVIYQDSGAVNV
jgi:hypothetical protein